MLGLGLLTVVSGSLLRLPEVQVKQAREGEEPDWWENAVFYQIYPRSFYDNDDNGVGDLRGIALKLPHLKEAGVTGIWMSPVFKSPMVDFGYDIQDFYEIDEVFGTMDDFQMMLFEAKRLGLRVVLDFVPNHSSDQSEWFQNSLNRVDGFEDFYVWRDPSSVIDGVPIPPNNWVSVFQGPAWTYSPERSQFYLHQFTKEQPDLNYRNPAVVAEMTRVLEFWLEKGVDGFRVDAINHMFESLNFEDNPPLPGVTNPTLYEHFDHIHSRDLPESYQVVYNWRDLLDRYAETNGEDTKVLMTEAYASIENTMLWYGSADGTRKGAHIPFNFVLISDLEAGFNGNTLRDMINVWLENMPEGANANWVVSIFLYFKMQIRIVNWLNKDSFQYFKNLVYLQRKNKFSRK